MIDDLVTRWNVDKGRSVLIGDKVTDVQAAIGAGIRGELFPGITHRIGNVVHRLTLIGCHAHDAGNLLRN